MQTIKIYENKGIYKVVIGEPFPPIEFPLEQKISSNKSLSELGLTIIQQSNKIIVEKSLDLKEHIIGLGEKAFELDRKRKRYIMYNVDAGAYKKYQDPLYVSIPFFISVKDGVATGYLFNSASKVIFDIGLEEYDKVIVTIPEESVELYVIEGPRIEDVLERYTELTGRPFLPPMWAFGYMISRYSYYPQDKVVELVDIMQKEGFRVAGVFLDIHYMDSYKLFTWHPKRFPEPKKMIDELHKRNVKLITIVDHGIRVDQNYSPFLSGMGKFCEIESGELFVGKMWPGTTVYPDFFREDTREWWAGLISEWLSQGVDGIWLDMNEPTDFSRAIEIRDVLSSLPVQLKDDRLVTTFPDNVVHYLRGKRVKHEKVRNAYPLYEAMATFEGFRTSHRNEIFILSRAGYSGIQRYAFIWTGDNTPSWDDLRLQLQLVLGLSISGIPYVGCDIGGFQGRSFSEIDNSLELLVRYYALALFFPFYRSHKATDGIDTEPIFLPEYYKEKVKDIINLRYKFLPYLYSLAVEASEKGHPIVRPLFYEFMEDDDMYRIEDEYIVGKYLLYAPVITKDENRTVILPKSKWYDYWSGDIYKGKTVIKSSNDLPIYIREDSIIPLDNNEFIVYGKSSFRSYDGTEIISSEDGIGFSSEVYVSSLTLISEKTINKVLVNNKELDVEKVKPNTFRVNVNGTIRGKIKILT
ncbi:MAG: alpha-glucosidase MalA [Saccharolobus sp.]|uniref:alpha-glucosidase MalA n=1 Tax=Saccharolobus TaxID=2100760 RepID=UPI001F0EC4A5|nr:alpha-glucosidase MalA [Saccharolobus shibatae]MCH4816261.1 glycoside hydrolase family 31 protein [Saccharolobus shibatae]